LSTKYTEKVTVPTGIAITQKNSAKLKSNLLYHKGSKIKNPKK
jgi:hypothetical protein